MTTNHSAIDLLFSLFERAKSGRDAERELQAVAEIYAERAKPKPAQVGASIEEPFRRVQSRHPVKPAAIIEFDGIPPYRDPTLVGAPLERHPHQPAVTARSLVSELLKKKGRAMTTREIQRATGLKVASVWSACSQMRANGEVERVAYGVYAWPRK